MTLYKATPLSLGRLSFWCWLLGHAWVADVDWRGVPKHRVCARCDRIDRYHELELGGES